MTKGFKSEEARRAYLPRVMVWSVVFCALLFIVPLLRNLLRLVDGLLNYLVGLVVAAFTEHRQRVGDMAAGTIVIRANNKMSK